MRIRLLGTGGYHPNERRHTACYLLPELGVALDAGTGAFRVAEHVAADSLDVFLTHPHLDHLVGLTYFIGLEHRGAPVRVAVHGSRETLRAVRECLFDKALFPLMTIDRFEELTERCPLRDGATLATFPLDHPGGSTGMRVDQGARSLAYVTDTTALGPEGIEAIRGVDLLIHEAYFTEAERDWAVKTGHSTAREAAVAARAAGARRLVLVHPDPRRADDHAALAEAAEVFPEVEMGRDGQEIVI